MTHVLRIRSMVYLLVCVMVFVTGCMNDKARHPPPTTLEEILANKNEGNFAGDCYNEKAVREQLWNLPRDLSPEEVYAYILGLVGETYTQYQEVYISLEENEGGPDQGSKGRDLLWKTNLSMSETYIRESNRLKTALVFLQERMDYKNWSVVNELIVNRLNMLSNYQMEQDLFITKKIIDESLIGSQ